MHTPNLETAVRRIRSLTAPVSTNLPDRELLQRFLKSRDEAAFAGLVERHGPAVLGVCRSVLNHQHDAEDAFQATFLVLSRRAASIQKHGSVGCWLHGVAFRVASKLKTRLAKQKRSTLVTEVSVQPNDDVSWGEIRRILDEEVNRLPEALRLPVLLCYFEGKTRDEAAETLGWKLTTLRGRLEDGRDRLRIRLARRGVELSSALLALSACTQATAIADALVETTIRCLSGKVSEAVRSLAVGIATGGMMQKLGFTIASLVLIVGVGTTLFPFRGQASDPPSPAEKPRESLVKKDELSKELLALMQSADRVWVVDEPTNEKPIPEPAEVLKGQSPPVPGFRFEFKVESLKELPRKGNRWIVFLKSIDEVDHIPKISKVPGETWYLPADEKTVALLRNYVPPCVWSDTAGGLRMGIWPRPGEPTVELVLQNDSEKELTLPQLRGNYWDDWSPLAFSITTPAGRTYTVHRHGPPLKDGDAPRERVLKPGERYIHVVRLNRWIVTSDKDRGFGLSNGGAPKGLFAPGGDFKVIAHYSNTGAYKLPGFWTGSLETKPVTVSVPKDGIYGDASGEFSLRLHPTRSIQSGDDPELKFDLRYSGMDVRRVDSRPIHTEVEVDGIWYRAISDKELVGIRIGELKPNSEQSPFITFKPDRTWFHLRTKPGTEDDPDAPKEAIPFRLTPGLRTVRVAYRFSETERPVSNPITIEVAPDGWGESSGGIKSRLRLAKKRFAAGEPLAFDLDLKNVSRRSLMVPVMPYNAGICLDGRWYLFHGQLDFKAMSKEIKPGEESSPFVEVKSSPDWKTNRLPIKAGETEHESLVLIPGTHKVRVSFVSEAGKVEPSSNELEFEVIAIDPAVHALADRADRIWVVDAPTPGKPIPTASEVLKGPLKPEASMFDLRLLPGEDPKKKFIVFVEETDHDGRVQLKRLSGDVWHLPYTAETARSIRQAIEPTNWSEEKAGIRLGLRLRKSIVTIGQPVTAEVTVNNNGHKEFSLAQHRMNMYDYWPDLRFEVTVPDGSKWMLSKPVLDMNEADNPLPITLKPGESYIQSVRLHSWAAQSTAAKAAKHAGTRFDQAGEHKVRARFIYSPPMELATWTADFNTPEQRLVMTKLEDWGAETGGLKARLRPAKTKFLAGEPFSFELDLMNVGKELLVDAPLPFFCNVQLDGDWYTYQLPISYPTGDVKLEPGKEYLSHVKVKVDSSWKFVPPFTDKGGGPNEAKTFGLKPGKHKVRVSYPVPGAREQRVTSQLVEIEVLQP